MTPPTPKARTSGTGKNSVEAVWNGFVAFLRQRGDRVTPARRIVLERVLQRHDHFRADQLAADLATGPERISRGTIYRTLALLHEAGIVREVRDGDMHVHYEHVPGHMHHEHLVCDRCGRFIEFTDSVIDEHLRSVCERLRFHQTSHRVTVFGICQRCAGKQ